MLLLAHYVLGFVMSLEPAAGTLALIPLIKVVFLLSYASSAIPSVVNRYLWEIL